MNKSFVKFISDFGPLAIFLFFYYNGDKNLKVAIPPFIIATIISLAVVWILERFYGHYYWMNEINKHSRNKIDYVHTGNDRIQFDYGLNKK